jgi:hypothetical protein
MSFTNSPKGKKLFVYEILTEVVNHNYTMSHCRTNVYQKPLLLFIEDNTDLTLYYFKLDMARQFIIFKPGSKFKMITDSNDNTCLHYISEVRLLVCESNLCLKIIQDLAKILNTEEEFSLQVENKYKRALNNINCVENLELKEKDIVIKFMNKLYEKVNLTKQEQEKVDGLRSSLCARVCESIVYFRYNAVNSDNFSPYIKELYDINNLPLEILNNLRLCQTDNTDISKFLYCIQQVVNSSPMRIKFKSNDLRVLTELVNIFNLLLKTDIGVSPLKDPINSLLKYIFENLSYFYTKSNIPLFKICDLLIRYITPSGKMNYIFTYLHNLLTNGDKSTWESEYKSKSRLYIKGSEYFNNFLI